MSDDKNKRDARDRNRVAVDEDFNWITSLKNWGVKRDDVDDRVSLYLKFYLFK